MQVSFTPTAVQTMREISTPTGTAYEWTVTFQMDGDPGFSCAISLSTPANTSLEAVAKTLPKVRDFLASAANAARQYQQ
jgi:hypothetical protein